jgi:hypothetical protein
MLGIAISCYQGHLSYLFDLFDSIEYQMVLPHKVVVSSSSTDENSQIIMNRALQKYNFPFEIIYHTTYKNASQNRNIALSYLMDMDYITFIDADDIMHPQRIEMILQVFNETNCDIILHNYSTDQVEETYYSNLNYRVNELIIHSSNCIEHLDNNYINSDLIHHSQSSVKKHVIDKIKFKEDNEYTRKEDCIFCSDVFRLENIKNAYITNKLSYYRPSNTIF